MPFSSKSLVFQLPARWWALITKVAAHVRLAALWPAIVITTKSHKQFDGVAQTILSEDSASYFSNLLSISRILIFE